MFDISKLTKLFCEHPFGKVLQGLFIAVMFFMFFEQYTDTFKLARLKNAAEILQTTEDNSAKAAISEQIQNELQEVLNPQTISPWWWRIICGWGPLLIVALLCWQSDKLAVLRLALYGLLFAIFLALLPDLLPSVLHCIAVSGCLILITIVVYNLHNLAPKKLASIRED